MAQTITMETTVVRRGEKGEAEEGAQRALETGIFQFFNFPDLAPSRLS